MLSLRVEGAVEDRVAPGWAARACSSRDRPARFAFYLHESVLRAPVGGPTVTAEQLRHLQRMSTAAPAAANGACVERVVVGDRR
jgi:hypothetical protein